MFKKGTGKIISNIPKKTRKDFNEMKNNLELLYQNEFIKKYRIKEDVKNENV